MTHLYEFFGVLLGCSLQGTDEKAFPAYAGETSQYQVHKSDLSLLLRTVLLPLSTLTPVTLDTWPLPLLKSPTS